MSRTTSCADPRACGVSFHVSGTAAARACRGQTARPSFVLAPPPAPSAPGAQEAWRARAALAWADLGRAALAQASERGWRPGAPHPTGGYDEVVVEDVGGRGHQAVLRYLRHGLAHREDGPAEVEHVVGLDRWHDPQETGRRWMREGALHRTDGPARSSGSSGMPSYHLGGRAVGGLEWSERRSTHERAQTLAGWGVAEVAPVLDYEALAGRRTTRALLKKGADFSALAAAWRAGVREPAALDAVAARRAPTSWAAPAR